MTTILRTGAVVAAVAVASLGAGACSSDKQSAPPVSTTTVPAGAHAAEASAPDWAAYGHDLANTRVNEHETKVTRTTVKRLKAGWSMKGLTGVTGTPTVVDGT